MTQMSFKPLFTSLFTAALLTACSDDGMQEDVESFKEITAQQFSLSDESVEQVCGFNNNLCYVKNGQAMIQISSGSYREVSQKCTNLVYPKSVLVWNVSEGSMVSKTELKVEAADGCSVSDVSFNSDQAFASGSQFDYQLSNVDSYMTEAQSESSMSYRIYSEVSFTKDEFTSAQMQELLTKGDFAETYVVVDEDVTVSLSGASKFYRSNTATVSFPYTDELTIGELNPVLTVIDQTWN